MSTPDLTPQQYADGALAALDRLEGLAETMADAAVWTTVAEHLDAFGAPHLAKDVRAHIAAHAPQHVLAWVGWCRRAVERDLRVLRRHVGSQFWKGCGVCSGDLPCSDATDAIDDLRGLYEALVGDA